MSRYHSASGRLANGLDTAPALAESLRRAADGLDGLRGPPKVADPMAEYRRLMAVESDLTQLRGLIGAFLREIDGGRAGGPQDAEPRNPDTRNGHPPPLPRATP